MKTGVSMLDGIKKHPKVFIAVDANSLVHRAFHAFPQSLVTSTGTQVNAVYGFTSMLLKVLNELSPKYIVCAFDRKEQTFRHAEFSDYKAHRKPTDESLIQQFPLVKQVLSGFNIPFIEEAGYEADDILGTLAKWVSNGKWQNEGLRFIILTGDKDLLQCVNENVQVLLPHGSFKMLKLYDDNAVNERFGFGPDFVTDYKGLVGDPSDNIPGVKGIGDKTATDMINKFGHLEDIYKNLDKLSPKAKNLLENGEELAALSRRLATIVDTVDFDLELEACLMRDFDVDTIVRIFQQFEFRSLISKIPKSINSIPGGQFDLFSSTESQKTIASNIKDFNVDSLNLDNVKNLNLCFFEKRALLFVGVTDKNSKTNNSSTEKIDYFDFSNHEKQDILKLLKLCYENKIKMSFFGWEPFCRYLYSLDLSRDNKLLLYRLSENNVFDIGIVAYYLSTGLKDYSINNLAFTYADMVLTDEELEGPERVKKCIDVIVAAKEKLQNMFNDKMESIGKFPFFLECPIIQEVMESVDLPLSLSTSEMTQNGIKVDIDGLDKKNKQVGFEISKLKKEIFDSIGHEFNLDSSRQLADVLFTELGLPAAKKTKTGYSTAEGVLRELEGVHPCISSILKYRELIKISNTYITPLLKYAKESVDGRVHSVFYQTSTTTGRLSSQDPNLQTIPTRSDIGKEIKNLFVAPKGRILLSADYSQMELRILAHYSGDKTMIDDFRSGVDFHLRTASRLLKKDEKDVTGNERRLAKTINFGVLYGLSAFGLSKTLNIERDTAAKYIEEYFNEYQGIQNYIDTILAFAKDTGYVQSLFGRRRYIGNLNSKNYQVRSAAEREAINMPTQSTVADIMRVAMNKIYKWILDGDINVKFLLQIHDELVFECDKKDVDLVSSSVAEVMGSIVKLKVPLVVNLDTGVTLLSKA
ncbi:DNA polymerase I [Candidatus Dojkabacteria bacterium]|nr:DNA polymerase I [Candidatus Dojkabacteria bacterium]